ncbi:MAG: hypothetical protein LIO85_00655 [Rikenellaceae bacterium]|nr:hypothetical protein [Rikenellaceae bacterium]MCC8174576.1 hypothetical protein [Odoribacter sp.]
MKRNNILVSEFRNFHTTIPRETVNIWEWLLGENPYKWTITKLRSLSIESARKRTKSTLIPAITVSGIFSERKKSGLIKHSGLICLDIDHIDDIAPVKTILSKLPYVIYAGLSSSGTGLFVIIEISNPDRHLEHYYSLERDFKELGIIIDPACKDITRLRGYSFDDDPYINWNAEIYRNTLTGSSVLKETDSPTGYTPVPATKERDLIRNLMMVRDCGDIAVYPDDIKSKIRGLTSRITYDGTDITYQWADWFMVCNIFAYIFGESGRLLFHKISRFYHKDENKYYDFRECDDLFDKCLLRPYRYSVWDFFALCGRYHYY